MKNINSKLMISVALIVVFAGGIYLGIKYNAKKGAEEPQVKEGDKEVEAPKVVDQSLVEEKTYNAPDTYATFDVKYPQFKNADAEFNAKIADMVTEGIVLHKKDSASNWKARYDTRSPGDKIAEFPKADEKFSYNVSWKSIQLNDKFISVIVITSGYTGGAHGYENIVSFNYDVKNKKEITLSSLFPNDPNYLKTISAFVRKDLQVQFRKNMNVKTASEEKAFKEVSIPWIEEGTMPEAQNFSAFTFTDASITFYFAQYQVGPYAIGEPKVVMSRK